MPIERMVFLFGRQVDGELTEANKSLDSELVKW
jgi:hypothetical protein